MITREEEKQLIYRFQQDNDLEARDQLLEAHAGWVWKHTLAAWKYHYPIFNKMEWYSIMVEVFIYCMERFDPDKGNRLTSYSAPAFYRRANRKVETWKKHQHEDCKCHLIPSRESSSHEKRELIRDIYEIASPHQKEVLAYIEKGYSFEETAQHLGVSRQCVSYHLDTLKRKLKKLGF